MRKTTLATATLFAIGLAVAPALAAGPREAYLAGLSTAAAKADPGFAGFSAERGETLFRSRFAGGKEDTPSCTSCHDPDPRKPGRTRAGKAIDPMAASAAPDRYTDPAKIEKWFRRNCNGVLGRECTAIEKGDFITFMLSR